MNKKKETSTEVEDVEPISVETAEQALNDLIVRGETSTGVTYDQAFAILKGADKMKMQELTANYHVFEEKGEYNFILDGFGEIELEGKQVPVVYLRDETGARLLNGDKVLYSSCKRVNKTLPAMIKVVYVADMKGDKGKYKDLRVYSF